MLNDLIKAADKLGLNEEARALERAHPSIALLSEISRDASKIRRAALLGAAVPLAVSAGEVVRMACLLADELAEEEEESCSF